MSPGAKLSDSDLDEIPAIVEYLTSTDPNLHTGKSITVELVNGEFQFSYERSRSACGVMVETDFSDDLISKFSDSFVSASPVAGKKDFVIISPALSAGSRSFVRLKVVTTP
jgi:hypothetical protein